MSKSPLVALLACIICLPFAVDVSAELATSQEMRQAAENWATEVAARTGTWAGTSRPEIVSEGEIRSDQGRLLARYYNFDPVGHVVVPVLKEMPPVKMYSDACNLGPEQEQTAIKLLRDILEPRLQAFETLYGDASVVQPADGLFDPIHKAEWNRLAVPAKEFRAETATGIEVEGGPITTSNWHQREPFSDLCPGYEGGNCVVGCVATAAAQIMAYWHWPESGVGSHSYYWDGDGIIPGNWLTVGFGDSYDWANIKDDYDTWTTAEGEAAAELSYEVGVALDMNYGLLGSGAYFSPTIFNDYFRYNPDIWKEYRADHTQASWFALIQSEVDAGRPIWYNILTHAIVCDGYRDTYGDYEYHMNYGWGGSYTAWFVMDNTYCYWVEGDVCPWDVDIMYGNIHPFTDPVLRIDGYRLTELPGGDGDGYIDGGESFQLDIRVKNHGNEITNVGASTIGADYLTMSNGNTTFSGAVDWGESAICETSLEFTVDPDPPAPSLVELEIAITADGGYSAVGYIDLLLGDLPGYANQMEDGAGHWRHTNFTMSRVDEWHLETERANGGSYSWKCGGAGSEVYSNLSDGALVTAPFIVPYNGEVDFHHCLYAQLDHDDRALDGAIVLVSAGDWIGSDWVQAYPDTGYGTMMAPSSRAPIDDYTPCYSGSFDWQKATFDLSAYAGEVAQVMFRFGADYSSGAEGWYIDDFFVCNTPAGSGIEMSPGPGATVAFDEVTLPGVTLADLSGDGPPVPGDFQTVPAVTEYHELSTTAEYTGEVGVCLEYDDAEVEGDEADLDLFAYLSDTWTKITSSVDVEANTICGTGPGLAQYYIVAVAGCCEGKVGDANGSGDEAPTIGDISTMIDAKFISESCEGKISCPAEADINLSASGEAVCDDITIGDISVLIDYLFITGPENMTLPDCP